MDTRSRLVMCVLLGAALWAAPPVAAAPVQPGVRLKTATTGCTANFIYDGTGLDWGRTFVGLASHCVGAVGEAVTDDSGGQVGKVVAFGPWTEGGNRDDWALVEIDPGIAVDPALVGHPDLPHGTVLDPRDAKRGDDVQFDGWGNGFDLTSETRQNRTGKYRSATESGLSYFGPASTGDSGGPVVDLRTGQPLGIVTELQIGGDIGSDTLTPADPAGPTTLVQGPSVVDLLARAAAKGITVQVRTIDSQRPAPPSVTTASPTTTVAPSRESQGKATRPKKTTQKCKAKARTRRRKRGAARARRPSHRKPRSCKPTRAKSRVRKRSQSKSRTGD